MKWKASIRKIFINGEKRELYLKVFNGIPEAPADGEQYVRKDRYWRKIEGAIDVDTEVTETSENPVKSSGIWAWGMNFFSGISNWVEATFVMKDGNVSELVNDAKYLTPETLNPSEFQTDSETGVVSINKIDAEKIEGLPEPPEFVSEKIIADKTLTVSDGGKHFYSETTVDIEVTVVGGIKEPLSIFQKGNGRVKLVEGAGVTLHGKLWTFEQGCGISVVPESLTEYDVMGGSDE